ncbi:glycoside hydrolase family protein [Desulfuromonas thiophila]|uniref:Lysozyme n=1 Tax=Desulfuromonas thiophila TaxID=57664 RepID=A0A1G7B0H5_9BACT|nr:glycoside hydrolase family protein [Desulfuromonas thiophila]SDE20618.1 lysozyme [Desulfuromonas thiophila]
MTMTDLEKQLIEDEELALKPYRCPAGKLTIGVGRNIEDVGITKEEALVLLRNDVARCRAALAVLPWFPALDPVRQDVLTNMCFNLGFAGLLKFRRMLAAVATGDYALAAREMLDSRWAKQVGRRALRLAKRMRGGE